MKNKYKSKFEKNVAKALKAAKTPFTYEETRFKFIQPEITRTYTPDFFLHETGVYMESKGKLTSDERKKLLWWRSQYPKVPFIILFMRAKNKIRKGSKTSYGDWATKNGFTWYDWETEGLPKIFQKKVKK